MLMMFLRQRISLNFRKKTNKNLKKNMSQKLLLLAKIFGNPLKIRWEAHLRVKETMMPLIDYQEDRPQSQMLSLQCHTKLRWLLILLSKNKKAPRKCFKSSI
jgi:hypothetical protein